MIGSILDKYVVLEKVGEGGMATVYRGRHQTLQRSVAIKVLHPHMSASARNRQRFAREARAIEHLRHPNIVEIYDYSGPDVPDAWIVTEFVQGPTLKRLLEKRGLLPSEVAARIGLSLADALAYAHAAGVVHRDIKPENVMIRLDGTVKLMDFGIARFLDEGSLTVTGALVGSPAYMSPEQACEKVVDPRSDLFSLGTLLFHLVAGQLPFTGSNASIILRRVIENDRPTLLEVQPGASPALADLVERLLDPDPDRRPPDAESVHAALLEVLEASEIDLDDERFRLDRYLREPDALEADLRAHLEAVLLRRGREALARGDHLGAQRLFNRLLAHEPDHPEVLALLAELHAAPEPPRRRMAAWWAGAVAALASGVAAWAWVARHPEPAVQATPSPPAVAPRAAPDRNPDPFRDAGAPGTTSGSPTPAAPGPTGRPADALGPGAATEPHGPGVGTVNGQADGTGPAATGPTTGAPAGTVPGGPGKRRAPGGLQERAAAGGADAGAQGGPAGRGGPGAHGPTRSAPASPSPMPLPPAEPATAPGLAGAVSLDQAPGHLEIHLARASWADVYIDGEHVGRLPGRTEFPVRPGEHRVVLRNPYAIDHVETVTVASGERVVLDRILLRKRPVLLRFSEDLDGDCRVLVGGRTQGVLRAIGPTLEVRDPVPGTPVEVRCPDGRRLDGRLGPPGTTLNLGGPS